MPDSGEISHEDITNLLNKLVIAKIDFIKVENLYNFDGKPGYSLAQGE
jgi:isocitrate dehydrogenase